MSGTMPDPASGANPFAELAKFALAATERNMALARDWSNALLTTLKEQSEDARANLTTLTAALEAMERTLTSQEETNRALRQSLRGVSAAPRPLRGHAGAHRPAGADRRRRPQGGRRRPDGGGEGIADATDGGDGGHRAVHADDAGVDRRLRPLQRRRNSRSPFILIRRRAADGFGELLRQVAIPGPIGSTTGSFAPCRLSRSGRWARSRCHVPQLLGSPAERLVSSLAPTFAVAAHINPLPALFGRTLLAPAIRTT